eukprot:362013-Chlamydomonas_euryale.AAC.1
MPLLPAGGAAYGRLQTPSHREPHQGPHHDPHRDPYQDAHHAPHSRRHPPRAAVATGHALPPAGGGIGANGAASPGSCLEQLRGAARHTPARRATCGAAVVFFIDSLTAVGVPAGLCTSVGARCDACVDSQHGVWTRSLVCGRASVGLSTLWHGQVQLNCTHTQPLSHPLAPHPTLAGALPVRHPFCGRAVGPHRTHNRAGSARHRGRRRGAAAMAVAAGARHGHSRRRCGCCGACRGDGRVERAAAGGVCVTL